MKTAWILLSLAGLLALGSSSCTIATPFRGPGLPTAPEPDAEVVVAVTHARLGPARGPRAEFYGALGEVLAALPEQSGLIGYSVRRRLWGREAWTLSMWTSEEALNGFVASRAHQRAVTRGDEGLEGSRFLVFRTPAASLPVTWKEALNQLETDERTYSIGYVPGDQ